MWPLDFATSSNWSRRGFVSIQIPASIAGFAGHALPFSNVKASIVSTRGKTEDFWIWPVRTGRSQQRRSSLYREWFCLLVNACPVNRSGIIALNCFRVNIFFVGGFYRELNETYEIIVIFWQTTLTRPWNSTKLRKQTFRMNFFF